MFEHNLVPIIAHLTTRSLSSSPQIDRFTIASVERLIAFVLRIRHVHLAAAFYAAVSEFLVVHSE